MSVGYVPYQFWNEADPRISLIVQNALRSYRHELLVPNFSGIPTLEQHGSADDNVPVFHSRRLNQLISQSNQPKSNHYHEVHGRNHWYDGVMTTEPLRMFYERILKDPRPPMIPSNFSIVVANTANMGSRGGLTVEQLRRPNQLGRVDVVRHPTSNIWTVKTSNISRFGFMSGRYLDDLPSELVIDGQPMGSLTQHWLLSHRFDCASNGRWSVSQPLFPHYITKAYSHLTRGRGGTMSDKNTRWDPLSLSCDPLAAFSYKQCHPNV